MPYLELECHSCQKSFRTTDLSLAEKKPRCPVCGGVYRVFGPEQDTAPPLVYPVEQSASSPPPPFPPRAQAKPTPAVPARKKGRITLAGILAVFLVVSYVSAVVSVKTGMYEFKPDFKLFPPPAPNLPQANLNDDDNPPIGGGDPQDIKPVLKPIDHGKIHQAARQEEQLLETLRQQGKLSPGPIIFSAPMGNSNARKLLLSHDGKEVYFVPRNTVEVWDIVTEKTKREFSTGDNFINHITLSPDGKMLFAVTEQGSLIAWNLADGSTVFRKLLGKGLRGLAVSPDGKQVAVATPSADAPGKNVIQFFTLPAGMPVDISLKTEFVHQLAFSPDGKLLATAHMDKDWVELWDLSTGKSNRRIWLSKARVIAFSPDGKYLAVGGGMIQQSFNLILMDLTNGDKRNLFVPAMNQKHVLDLAFSPDGKYLATLNEEGSLNNSILRLWDTATGRHLQHVASKYNRFVQFSPGGRFIFAGYRGFRLFDVNDLLAGKGQVAQVPPADKKWTTQGALTEIRKWANVYQEPDGTYNVYPSDWATNANLAMLRHLPNISSLGLGGTFSDAGLVHVKELKNLKKLYLYSSARFTDAGLAHLQDLKSLELLHLTYHQNVTDEGLAHLKGLTNLQDLNLGGCKNITGDGLAHLAGMKNLKWLNLYNVPVSGGLVHLSGLSELEDLTLDNQNLEEDDLKNLAGLTRMKRLFLSTCGLADHVLTHLKGMTDLRFLTLSNNPDLEGTGLVHLQGMKNLEHLNLGNTRVGDAGLAHLKDLTTIKNLFLYSTQVTDAGLAHVATMTNLLELHISELKSVKGPGLVHLQGLTKIADLNLHGTGVDDDGLQFVSGLTYLRGLILPKNISDKGFKHLAGLTNLDLLEFYDLKNLKGPGLVHLKKLTQLTSLELGGTGLTDDGLQYLAELTHLEFVTLPEQISDKGLEHLKNMSSLRSIGLHSTQVEGPGLAHLKHLDKLTELYLNNAKITDAGLAAVKDLTRLVTLNLTGTKISDAGLKHLENLPQLRNLYLRDTQVTTEAVAEFRKAHPKINIVK